jgi:hypothetical protein
MVDSGPGPVELLPIAPARADDRPSRAREGRHLSGAIFAAYTESAHAAGGQGPRARDLALTAAVLLAHCGCSELEPLEVFNVSLFCV